jgi:hypothetical protein
MVPATWTRNEIVVGLRNSIVNRFDRLIARSPVEIDQLQFLRDNFHRQTAGPLTGGLAPHAVSDQKKSLLSVDIARIFIVVALADDAQLSNSQLHDALPKSMF